MLRIETPGFIIYDMLPGRAINQTTVQKTPDPPTPSEPPRPISDEMRSASATIEYQTHLLSPVYQDEKPSGEWRVYFFRRGTRPIKNIPWDRHFDSQEAAEKWVESVLEKIRKRK